MRETVTVRIWLDAPSLISALLASLFHLCCLMIMFISLKFYISLWRVVGWNIACHLCSYDWMFRGEVYNVLRKHVFSLSHVYLVFWVWTELLEKAKSQVNLLKKQNKKLAKVVGGCLGQYYRWLSSLKRNCVSFFFCVCM